MKSPSIYSFNPFRAIAYLWRARRVPVVPIPEGAYPLYKGTPSFLARWALPFLSLDVMYMTSMAYECWEGGQLYPNVLKNTRKGKPEDAQSPTPTPTPPKSPESEVSEKKEVWKRVAFAAFHCGLGGLIAVWLLSQRSSWVRTMAVVRPSKLKAPAQLYIEVSGHPTGYGHPFLMRDCTLMGYTEAKDVMLVNTGTEGKFPFFPLGSTIGGKEMPAKGDLAKINMLKIWKALGGQIERKY
ncbi:hypothetical protein CPB84DRAFT_1321337 [Gymnopilus junonius]|uniref:Uncharacterized protein n=1 Tax=Gymnopilus junonius TaxID=109634 RepID=A0A9P5NHU6_GYMJU|nr:hypothetical protein CPB84DRAFT_1321337 [Gymnopilus junonius]